MLIMNGISPQPKRHRSALTFILVVVVVVAAGLAPGVASAQTAPVAVDNFYGTIQNTALVIAAPGVLGNDTDADGDTLSVYQVNGTTNVGATITITSGATLTVNSNGSFTYTPASLFSGNDSFTYAAADDETPTPRISNEATVTIAVATPRDVYVAGCVNESNGENNNCTANDLTFVELGLGTQTDGCVNNADRVTILMRGVVQNTTAQARYDVGMWFPFPDPDYPDPGGLWDFQIDPEGDGAYYGVCGVVGLMNPESVPVSNSCTWDSPAGKLGLDSGGGPWVNAENKDTEKDACGDIYANAASTVCDRSPADGRWDDSIVDFISPLTLDCSDADENGLLDGFVNTSVCLTWGNQPNQVDNSGEGLCDDLTELQPGTKSKCRCEQYQITNVPSPELRFACPESPTETGGVVTMAFTYDNVCSCTPDTDPDVPYRFKCCTASYIEFVLGYDTGEGSVTNASLSGFTNGEVDTTTAGQIVWRPGSAASGDGIIPESDTDTLTVEFTLSGSTLSPFTITTYWANSISGGVLVDPVEQIAMGGSCSINLNSTWASVSDLSADVRDGRTVVSWETSAEVASVGFDVFRSDGPGSGWIKINEALIPALGDGPGGRYELIDAGAPIEGTVSYKVLELDARGRELETRPVEVNLRATAVAPPHDVLVREPRQPSSRMTKAKQRADSQRTKTVAVREAPSGGRMVPDRPMLVKIGVAETGLYRVDAADIAAALGEALSKTSARIAQHKLALTTGGEPVAWKAEPNAGGILFYGEAPDSIFDAERYYLLRRDRGLALEERGGFPSQPDTTFGSFPDTVVFEHNVLLRPFNVFEEGADYWFWDAVLADSPTYGERHLEVELEGVAASTTPARLKMAFVGFAPGLSVSGSLYINDHYVGVFYGQIAARNEAVVRFNQAYLNDGINDIKIIARQGGMLIDRVDVSYDRRLSTSTGELTVRSPDNGLVSVGGFTSSNVAAYDVTDPLRPVLLPVSTTGYAGLTAIAAGFEAPAGAGTYLVVAESAIRRPSSIAGRERSELRGNFAGADYVIITTAELAGTAERLAQHHRDGGLEAVVVDVEDIFDDFAFGSRDPAAIRSFLSYAADNWATVPRYLLLAGRGHYDPKDHLGYGGDLVPPMLAATDSGLIPSDNSFVDLDGDGLPELAVGRLPVLSSGELDGAIDKIIAYDSQAAGPWARRVMLVADDPDQAGDFIRSTDSLALALPADREVARVHLFNPYEASEVNALILGALDEGIGIVNWTGHAGFDALANERVLTIEDLEDLASTNHPSLVVGLTCLINNFGFPYYATLGEELSLRSGGGALGVWAASGLSNNSQAEQLGENFMASLGGPGPQRLGDLILNAIDDFAGSYAGRKLANEYVLFGDPAMILKQ